MSTTLQTAVSEASAALGSAGTIIGGSAADAAVDRPRFELFNGANSICSQKVRVVLAHHQVAYVSHTMNMFIGQTYLPEYVRLRMIACDRLGVPLMDRHTGSTSVSNGGCDPAVVPTLIDWQAGDVIVDSKRICFHIDEAAGGAQLLRPPALSKLIDAELEIVDNLPNYQMLSGIPPGDDTRPESRRKGDGTQFAMSKVERCDAYLKQHANDAALVRGYTAKRSKELTAAEQLFTPAAMASAYSRAESACEGLEQKLAAKATPWLFGDKPTMADLYWTVELLRMENIGAHGFWRNNARPNVEAYLAQGRALDAIRSAILDWPGAMF